MRESSDSKTVLDYDKFKYVIERTNIEKNDKEVYKEILLNHKTITVVFNNKNSSSVKIDTDISFGRIVQLSQIFPEENVFFALNKDESISLSKDTRSKIYKYHIQTKMDIFFYYYIKLLYIFYLVASILIFVHLMTLILKSKCKFKSFYLWFSLILVIAMLYLGNIGVSKFNGVEVNENNNEDIYDQDYMFWYNFIVLFLTMCTFIFLINEHYIYIKNEKYVGVIIISFYIIILLIEIFALLFFDLTNKIYELKKNDGYILLEANEENEKLINI